MSILKGAGTGCTDNNPYLYLWNHYSDLDSEIGQFLHAILDEYNLALD